MALATKEAAHAQGVVAAQTEAHRGRRCVFNPYDAAKENSLCNAWDDGYYRDAKPVALQPFCRPPRR